MLPVGVGIATSYSELQYWASRGKRFGIVARTRMTQALGGASVQMGFGVVHPTPFGLILGHVLYNGMGVVGLVAEPLAARSSLARLGAARQSCCGI